MGPAAVESAQLSPTLSLCVVNAEPQPTTARGFAVELGGQPRIVRAHLHAEGRWGCYRTVASMAWAVSISGPSRFKRVQLRWNLDEGGEPHLEEQFRMLGQMYRLDDWIT